MRRTVEFFYDYGSPTAYLAWAQLAKLAQDANAKIIRKPILLGGIFKGSNNRSPMEVQAKSAWMRIDLLRFSQKHDICFRHNPFFPINTLLLMRGAIWAKREGVLDVFDQTVFQAIWMHGKDMGDPDVVGAVLARAGIDTTTLLAGCADPDIKQALIAETQIAVGRGIFGTPTFFVGPDMFFGQDRLDFVRQALMSRETA